jgi:hypothetical protein
MPCWLKWLYACSSAVKHMHAYNGGVYMLCSALLLQSIRGVYLKLIYQDELVRGPAAAQHRVAANSSTQHGRKQQQRVPQETAAISTVAREEQVDWPARVVSRTQAAGRISRMCGSGAA